MRLSNELEVGLVRHSSAIKSWVQSLCDAPEPSTDEQTEVSSWFRSLSLEQRARLESDTSRLGSEGESLTEITSGPLGELLSRFSSLLLVDRKFSNLANPGSPNPTLHSLSEEIGEILQAQGELEQLDPIWFADWEAFEKSLGSGD